VGAWYQQAHATRYGRARLATAGAVPVADDAGSQLQDEGSLRSPFASTAPPVRTDPDTWLASGDHHVLVGAPGSGKTTFLRHLVLDMLSDSPALTRWARRLGDRLPVWLPFHFFTWRQARYRDANASVAATLRAWLEQHDEAGLWPLVEVALEDERLLLVVDGLDEWVSESAGRSALAGLETFLGTREVPALVSARPPGATPAAAAGIITLCLLGQARTALAALALVLAAVALAAAGYATGRSTRPQPQPARQPGPRHALLAARHHRLGTRHPRPA
jgi:energy-coupling factor transporter ATP-binding protein EcfA2